jgi:hypothetical protein
VSTAPTFIKKAHLVNEDRVSYQVFSLVTQQLIDIPSSISLYFIKALLLSLMIQGSAASTCRVMHHTDGYRYTKGERQDTHASAAVGILPQGS